MLLELYHSRAGSNNSSNNFYSLFFITRARKKMRRNLRRKRKLKKLRENEKDNKKKVSFAVFYKAKCYLLCRSFHKFFICNRIRIDVASSTLKRYETQHKYYKTKITQCALNSKFIMHAKIGASASLSCLLYLLYCAIRTGRLFHDR